MHRWKLLGLHLNKICHIFILKHNILCMNSVAMIVSERHKLNRIEHNSAVLKKQYYVRCATR